jgi:hypothetical protein
MACQGLFLYILLNNIRGIRDVWVVWVASTGKKYPVPIDQHCHNGILWDVWV